MNHGPPNSIQRMQKLNLCPSATGHSNIGLGNANITLSIDLRAGASPVAANA